MADGAFARVTTRAGAITLDVALNMIETGCAPSSLAVDLGGGVIARADDQTGVEALAQRLRGHRMLMAMAAGAPDTPKLPTSNALSIGSDVQEMLDAVRKPR